MKSLVLTFLMIISNQVLAFPIVCETPEMDQGKTMLRFKIHHKRTVVMNEDTWNLYLIGVTPSDGLRQIVYASGLADNKRISLTFVKDQTVLGSARAEIQSDGSYFGKANLSGMHKSKSLEVICHDEGLK